MASENINARDCDAGTAEAVVLANGMTIPAASFFWRKEPLPFAFPQQFKECVLHVLKRRGVSQRHFARWLGWSGAQFAKRISDPEITLDECSRIMRLAGLELRAVSA